MQHTLKVSPDDNLFSVKTEGNGDVEGICAFLKDIISHPLWKPGNNILLDHRRLSLSKIQTPGIQEVSIFFKSISAELGDGKLAIVMNRDIDFGIARAWETITEQDVDIRIYVFRDMEQAMSWLSPAM